MVNNKRRTRPHHTKRQIHTHLHIRCTSCRNRLFKCRAKRQETSGHSGISPTWSRHPHSIPPELTSSLSHLSDHNPHITTSELYTLLTKHNSSINLFTTSSESGTFDKYSRSLCQIDSTISLKDLSSGQFFDNTDLVTINDNGRPYILLGAGDYKVESLNDDISSGKCLLLPLIDNSGQTITKPHFMYLIAYPTEKEDERQIAQNVAEFLKRLNLDTHKKIRDTRIRVRDTRVLIPLDSLEEWH